MRRDSNQAKKGAQRAAHGDDLVLSCEHGGNDVPVEYLSMFAPYRDLLRSHRGWDPGALDLARQMAQALGCSLHASTITRLLVDLNRSIGHRQLFSEVTRALALPLRERIIARHYRPYREKVSADIARRVGNGRRVLHIASHSFTPVLGTQVRHADVAWLYDPRRPGEAQFARAWMGSLSQQDPKLQLRRNYPYRGRADGLAAQLRARYDDASYIGIELEVNQRFVEAGGQQWHRLRARLVDSLAATLAGTRDAPP